jgi:hypothetical protein
MAARPVRLVLFMVAALIPAALVARPASTPPGRGTPAPAAPVAYEQQPLAFELNRGQADDQVAFLARAAGYRLFLTPDEAVLALDGATVRLSSVGANPAAQVTGVDRGAATVNYFTGNSRLQGVPTYGQVKVANLYPGIDVEYYGDSGQLEYDYLVAPGADPTRIGLDVAGATSTTIDARGDLVLDTVAGAVVQQRPVAYQEVGGNRRPVTAEYLLEGPSRVRLQLGAYDRALPLVIDPVIAYSTYLGGSTPGLGDDEGDAIEVDADGNAYVTGRTASTNFPVANAFDSTLGGSDDAFVTKLSPTGGLLWSTYLGGDGLDHGLGVELPSPGTSVFVTGLTTSAGFPTVNAFDATLGGTQDAFLTGLSSATGTLLLSTFFGGDGDEAGNSICAYPDGSLVVTGFTTSDSTSFPLLAAHDGALGGTQDAFVAEFTSAGLPVFATYLGGDGDESGQGVSIGQLLAYVTGFTTSSEASFPLLNPFDGTLGGTQDAFLTTYLANGTLNSSSFLGGGGDETGYAVTTDGSTLAFVTGSTGSTDFPTNGFDTTLAGTTDAFVTHFSNSGTTLAWSTYLGGAGDEAGYGIALDSALDPWVTGFTSSGDFPTLTPFDGDLGGPADAFVTELSSDGTTVLYSTYLGGAGDDQGFAIDVLDTDAHVTGFTTSADFPTLNAHDSTLGGTSDGFVTKLADDIVPPTCFVTAFSFGPPRVWSITVQDTGTGLAAVTAVTQTNGNLAGTFSPGSTAPEILTFTKTTAAQPSFLQFDVTDVEGNTTTCTPLRQSLPGVVTSSLNWKLRDVLPGSGPPTHLFTFGSTPLVSLMGDWDGDGIKTPAYFKGGVFNLSNNLDGTGTLVTFAFGDTRGYPVAGDWNGNGTDEVAVFRNGLWQVRANALPGTQPLFTANFSFGAGSWPATVPLAGDWDGNGVDGIGHYMGNGAGTGTWNLRQTASGGVADIGPFTYEPTNPGYPVVGDWDADGDVTVGTKSGLTWQLRNTNSAGPPDLTISMGSATPAQDLPMVWSAT